MCKLPFHPRLRIGFLDAKLNRLINTILSIYTYCNKIRLWLSNKIKGINNIIINREL